MTERREKISPRRGAGCSGGGTFGESPETALNRDYFFLLLEIIASFNSFSTASCTFK